MLSPTVSERDSELSAVKYNFTSTIFRKFTLRQKTQFENENTLKYDKLVGAYLVGLYQQADRQAGRQVEQIVCLLNEE